MKTIQVCDEVFDKLQDLAKEYEFNYAFKEQNCFFTAKACDEHIAKNHYHYKEPCSFGNTFWRNPEMQLIANFLVELAKFSNKKEEHDDN